MERFNKKELILEAVILILLRDDLLMLTSVPTNPSNFISWANEPVEKVIKNARRLRKANIKSKYAVKEIVQSLELILI